MQYLSEKFNECYQGHGVPSEPMNLPTMYAGRCYTDLDTGITYIDTDGDGSGWEEVGGGGTVVKTVTPTLSGPASGNEDTDVTVTITNYNAAYTYAINSR